MKPATRDKSCSRPPAGSFAREGEGLEAVLFLVASHQGLTKVTLSTSVRHYSMLTQTLFALINALDIIRYLRTASEIHYPLSPTAVWRTSKASH